MIYYHLTIRLKVKTIINVKIVKMNFGIIIIYIPIVRTGARFCEAMGKITFLNRGNKQKKKKEKKKGYLLFTRDHKMFCKALLCASLPFSFTGTTYRVKNFVYLHRYNTFNF